MVRATASRWRRKHRPKKYDIARRLRRQFGLHLARVARHEHAQTSPTQLPQIVIVQFQPARASKRQRLKPRLRLRRADRHVRQIRAD